MDNIYEFIFTGSVLEPNIYLQHDQKKKYVGNYNNVASFIYQLKLIYGKKARISFKKFNSSQIEYILLHYYKLMFFEDANNEKKVNKQLL